MFSQTHMQKIIHLKFLGSFHIQKNYLRLNQKLFLKIINTISSWKNLSTWGWWGWLSCFRYLKRILKINFQYNLHNKFFNFWREIGGISIYLGKKYSFILNNNILLQQNKNLLFLIGVIQSFSSILFSIVFLFIYIVLFYYIIFYLC
jgi:hypothetical protein